MSTFISNNDVMLFLATPWLQIESLQIVPIRQVTGKFLAANHSQFKLREAVLISL